MDHFAPDHVTLQKVGINALNALFSPSRPRRSHKRQSIYDGELVQPNKRHKRRN